MTAPSPAEPLTKRLIRRLALVVTSHPWPFILVFMILALGVGSRVPTAEVDPETKSMLPADFPTLLDLDEIEKVFGGSDLLMITVVAGDVLEPETLKQVKLLSDGLERLPQVDRVLSLFELKDIRSENNAMVVSPAVEELPATAAQRDALRENLKDNDLVYGTVVSKDFKATAVVALLGVESKDEELLPGVLALLEQAKGPGEVHVAGMPQVRTRITRGIRGDMQRFFPAGLLVMLIFLFYFFRQLRGMLLPFLVVVMSAMFTMGMVPLMGWKIQMITVLLPVILLAIANDYGIHLIARYQEVNTPGSQITKGELARNVFIELAAPITVAGITTMAGMLCLMMHIIVPAKELGILAALGIGYALLCSLFLIPALLSLLPRAKPIVTAASTGEGKRALLDRVLVPLARWVSGQPKAILIGSVLLVGVIALGISRVKVDTNVVNYFPADDPLVIANNVADEHFGGAVGFSVTMEGDIKHPETLRQLDALERALRDHPKVDQTSSIARVIRRMNKVMSGGDAKHDKIPDTRDGVAQLLLMYENSGEPEDFERLVNFKYSEAQLTARIASASTADQSDVIRYARKYIAGANVRIKAEWKETTAATRGKAAQEEAEPAQEEDDSPFTMEGEEEDDSPFTMDDEPGEAPDKKAAAAAKPDPPPPAGPPQFHRLAGFGVIFNDLVDAVIRGQLSSLGLSLLLVVIIVAVLFRSLVGGLMAGGTLALAMAILFGMMGLLNFDLNMPTAMLSSIMIGVGVDYTIHFLWRFRQERRDGQPYEEAVQRTLTTSGRGIIINALSVVVGFAVMFISSFLPVRTFGFLVVVSISACLLGAMVLMPALVLLFKPKFLEPAQEFVNAPAPTEVK